MRLGTVVLSLALALLVLILVVSVYNDAQGEPQMCERINGSVCTLEDNCPSGFSENNRAVCFADDWRCCVPD